MTRKCDSMHGITLNTFTNATLIHYIVCQTGVYFGFGNTFEQVE